MSEPTDLIFQLMHGGVAAQHPRVPEAAVVVAPSETDAKHNTLRLGLVPFACWRAHDLRFGFASSFVLPEISTELRALKELIDLHTLRDATGQAVSQPALSIFGHADATGDDVFNQALGGRRAQAVYGMLTRNTELWEQLYLRPLGEDNWEQNAIPKMQQTLGRPLSSPLSASERSALFSDYMDHVCAVRGEDDLPIPGQTLRVDPKDFLARGIDPQGKGDYQSCGEFNPILVLSQSEAAAFSDPERKEERNQEHAPNRRVLIFLFRPGVQIDPGNWPCPRVDEGSVGCRKRFWIDGEQRRTPGLVRREYQDTRDTFACRFYDRLSQKSPCEIPPPPGMGWLAVRIFFLARPMRGLSVTFRPLDGSTPLLPMVASTDDEGIAFLKEPVDIGYYRCEVEEQNPTVVPTVFSKDEPAILVLPIGRPYLSIDHDRDYIANGENVAPDETGAA